eukprot:TRINITY_DN8856_c0_g1_i1.p1 TRINITY_DN8856_c0_g1~~TRINITY_DN8856_c0_g1_i1.p1  ORF type:complete len:130 (-),score=31.36 TRINITY_DN8856_c0_g1_i1:179-568(-)
MQRLVDLLRQSSPFTIAFHSLFVAEVTRIKHDRVFAIGVKLASTGMRALKDAWLEPLSKEARLNHDPYQTEGHISIAYIRPEFVETAEKFIAEKLDSFRLEPFTVRAVVVTESDGRHTTVDLKHNTCLL